MALTKWLTAAQYEVFEQMYYVCFHHEYEHGPAATDEVCEAGDQADAHQTH